MQLNISDDFDEVNDYLSQSRARIITDIETTSLEVPWGRIICVGFAPADRNDVMVWWPESAEELARLRLKHMVAHNAPFEHKWFLGSGCDVDTDWDTLMMAYLLDENRIGHLGLKELGHRLLRYDDWADGNVADYGAEFGQHWGDKSPLSPRLLAKAKLRVSKYNGMDVHVTRDLYKWQRRYIAKKTKPGEDPVRVMQQVMIPAIEPLRQMEANELPVRTSLIAKTRERVEDQIAEIEQTLDSTIPDKSEWPDWLQKTKPKWGATNWTKWWLYEYNGAICPQRNKPTKAFPEGAPSLADEVLAKVDHPGARMLQKRAALYSQLTKFLIPLTDRTVDGRVPTRYNLTGTVTGRLSSSSPGDHKPGINSQQIPRDRATRNLFGERGMAWIEADFSQLELRVAARLANEPTMLELFEADEDIHKFIGRRITRTEELTKEQRSLAKGVNFGFLYGMRATHFGNYVFENYGVKVSPKESEAFREEYFTLFSALPAWYRKQRKEAIEYGGVHNEFGRFRHLPKVYDENFWIQENAFRQAINSPVQSLGSDFMLISLGRLSRDLRLPALGAKLIATVHDSVCLTAPYKTARRVGRIVKETMEQADDSLDRKFFLKADVTISRCWGGEPLAEF